MSQTLIGNYLSDLAQLRQISGSRRESVLREAFDDQIRVGVAVWFCVKKKGAHGCHIFYEAVRDYAKSDEKRDFLAAKSLRDRVLEEIRPDEKANWLNLTHNDFDELLPVIDKDAKLSTKATRERAIFKLFGNGINTARDDWVTDFDRAELKRRVEFFLDEYQRHRAGSSELGTVIKWSRNLKVKLSRSMSEQFEPASLRRYAYRPFVPQFGYLSRLLVDELGQWAAFDGDGNRSLNFLAGKTFTCLASDLPTDFHFTGDTKTAALYRFENGQRVDNITDWALKQFTSHYKAGPGKRLPEPTKVGIFHYVYALLHDPIYRDKYAQNLKREFPRIPLYGSLRADFWRWADWGRELMDLHIGYESVEPWPPTRTDMPDEKARAAGQAPKCLLKPDPEAGRIAIDSETVLAGVPPEAWNYRLGNRSAIDWVLDQHKERKPKDPTIRARFDTYRFADHKERVIDLLAHVVRVSVETLRIVQAVKAAPR